MNITTMTHDHDWPTQLKAKKASLVRAQRQAEQAAREAERGQRQLETETARKEREKEREEELAQVVAAQELARIAESERIKKEQAEVQWEQGYF